MKQMVEIYPNLLNNFSLMTVDHINRGFVWCWDDLSLTFDDKLARFDPTQSKDFYCLIVKLSFIDSFWLQLLLRI